MSYPSDHQRGHRPWLKISLRLSPWGLAVVSDAL